jgi:5-oxoprolinase (ATP-hydrolysing)
MQEEQFGNSFENLEKIKDLSFVVSTCDCYFEVNGGLEKIFTPIYNIECGASSITETMKVEGPALLLNKNSTIVLEPSCRAIVNTEGSVLIHVRTEIGKSSAKSYESISDVPLDPIELSIFSH